MTFQILFPILYLVSWSHHQSKLGSFCLHWYKSSYFFNKNFILFFRKFWWTNPNPNPYRSTLLEEKTVFKICFLEDVLSITNVLCVVLQTDKKDFSVISRAISNCIKMLKVILTNKNTDLIKSFNSSCTDKVKKTDDYQMQLTVSGSTRKKRIENRF